jgi:hypothetical protein
MKIIAQADDSAAAPVQNNKRAPMQNPLDSCGPKDPQP